MSHGADALLFSYGTLQLESVQLSQFGRLLEGSDDTLHGWRQTEITIRDPDVLEASGIETHLALVPDLDAPPIPGKVFRLSEAELAAADVYESENYVRVEAPLASGTTAWVYVKACLINPPRACLGEGDRRRRRGWRGRRDAPVPGAPLHHSLREWSPSPSKLGEEFASSPQPRHTPPERRGTARMTTAPSAPARLAGLDLFRGLTMAFMVIVNTPGSWAHVWWPLDHAEWHGFTPTDLVFPAFLCAMGVALGLSFPRRIDRALWARIGRRTLLLILIGWAWQMLARPGLADFRVFGVLPRLGLCYGLAATLAILTARRDGDGRAHLSAPALGLASLMLLLGYWALLTFLAAPGHAAGDLSPAGNLAGYVDRITVGIHHMYRFGTDEAGNIVYDPEGLLSTLPALVNVLLGALAALWWKAAPDRATMRLLLAGIALAALGYALSFAFPLNKKLWTSSFALFTSGLSAILFAGCIVAAGHAGVRKALWPLDVLGMNAILGYLLSLLLSLALMRSGLQLAAWNGLAALLPGNLLLASFLFALAVLLVVLALLVPLHRRGIHLRL